MATNKYVNRKPSTTSEKYLDDIAFYNNENIRTQTVNGKTLTGTITVTPGTPSEVQVGEEQLAKRHTVGVLNDTSFLIFISPDANSDPNDRILIGSGVGFEISMNPSIPSKLYVFSPYRELELKVFEVG